MRDGRTDHRATGPPPTLPGASAPTGFPRRRPGARRRHAAARAVPVLHRPASPQGPAGVATRRQGRHPPWPGPDSSAPPTPRWGIRAGGLPHRLRHLLVVTVVLLPSCSATATRLERAHVMTTRGAEHAGAPSPPFRSSSPAPLYLVYGTVLCGWARGQTVGMMAVGVRAVRDETFERRRLRAGVLAGRWSRAFSAPRAATVILGVVWLLDMLFPLWDKKRQTLHDKVAGSVVLRVPGTGGVDSRVRGESHRCKFDSRKEGRCRSGRLRICTPTPSSPCSTARPGSATSWPRPRPTGSPRSASPTTGTCTGSSTSTRPAATQGIVPDHRHRVLHGGRVAPRAPGAPGPGRRHRRRRRGRAEALLPPDPAGRDRRGLPQPDEAVVGRLPRGLLLQAPGRLGAARAPPRRA